MECFMSKPFVIFPLIITKTSALCNQVHKLSLCCLQCLRLIFMWVGFRNSQHLIETYSYWTVNDNVLSMALFSRVWESGIRKISSLQCSLCFRIINQANVVRIGNGIYILSRMTQFSWYTLTCPHKKEVSPLAH